jgi:hypothetical protein
MLHERPVSDFGCAERPVVAKLVKFVVRTCDIYSALAEYSKRQVGVGR